MYAWLCKEHMDWFKCDLKYKWHYIQNKNSKPLRIKELLLALAIDNQSDLSFYLC